MDFDTLSQRVLAARTLVKEVDGHSFSLRLPTEQDSLIAARELGSADLARDPAGVLLLERALLERALVGWQGPRLADLLPDDPDGATPLAWAPGVPRLLLDARPDWAAELAAAMTQALTARRQRLEAARKN